MEDLKLVCAVCVIIYDSESLNPAACMGRGESRLERLWHGSPGFRQGGRWP